MPILDGAVIHLRGKHGQFRSSSSPARPARGRNARASRTAPNGGLPFAGEIRPTAGTPCGADDAPASCDLVLPVVSAAWRMEGRLPRPVRLRRRVAPCVRGDPLTSVERSRTLRAVDVVPHRMHAPRSAATARRFQPYGILTVCLTASSQMTCRRGSFIGSMGNASIIERREGRPVSCASAQFASTPSKPR